MFNLPSLPRTLSAAQADIASQRREIRQGAVRDLARIGSARDDEGNLARATLTQLLEHSPFPDVRGECALALADVGVGEALPALVRACGDVNERVREMALIAIGELVTPADRSDGNVALVHEVELALKAPSSEHRFQALLVAGRVFSEERLLAVLTDARGDPDALVRYRAMRVVEERWLSAEPVPLPTGIGELLEQGLRDVSVPVRTAAALAYRHLPESQHASSAALTEALLDGLRHKGLEPEDEEAVIDAVAALRVVSALAVLREKAWGILPHRFAWQARIALARLGDPRAQSTILRGLRGWGRDTRTLAVVAAGRAQLVQARPLIVEMRGDNVRADQEAVEQALTEIPEEERG